MVVCHTCDNPPCVNPAHLFLGTQSDNTQDMMAKGRHRAAGRDGKYDGNKNPRAKLTWEQVREIRKAYKAGQFQKVLAQRYGVNQTNIGFIVRNVTWTEEAA